MTPEELVSWRTTRNMTQPRLAIKLGVHRNTVSNWENGTTPLPPSLAEALAKIAPPPITNRPRVLPRKGRYFMGRDGVVRVEVHEDGTLAAAPTGRFMPAPAWLVSTPVFS